MIHAIAYSRVVLGLSLLVYGLIVAHVQLPVAQASIQDLPAPYGPIVTYGPVGLFVVLYLTGQMVTKRELQRESSRADRAEQQRDALSDQILNKVLPPVLDVQNTMVPTLERLTAEVTRMSERLDRLDQLRSRS